MNRCKSVLAAALALALLSCASEEAPPEEPKAARGAELLFPFKKDLKQALVAGMEQGPVNAISVCKDQAPAIAASLAVDGVRMGRTSHRLRNPANVAPAWVKPVYKSYLDDGDARSPRTVALPDDREGYIEPIMLQSLCVTCHGQTLTPDVAAQIEAEYPDDEATGFEVGDLRGVFWIEYPAVD